MLTTELVKKIQDFVYTKPRTIQELAQHIGKNWRTADRYVERIAEEYGTIATRTFREGTRGALKIVYWCSIEHIHSTSFQEKLFEEIARGKRKEDFSPFDIYQLVPETKKEAFLEEQEYESSTAMNRDLLKILKEAKKQILLFSGNLSWTNISQDGVKFLEILEELADRGISIKVLTRVDLPALENTKKMFAINSRLKKNMIEIRHREHPLRAIIVDNKIARFKEEKNPEQEKGGKKKVFIFYNVYDREWIEWLQKVFWNLFTTAISAEKRIKELESIQNIKKR